MKMQRWFRGLTCAALLSLAGSAMAQNLPPPPSLERAMAALYGPHYFPARKMPKDQADSEGLQYERPVVQVGKMDERVRPWVISRPFLFEGEYDVVAFGEGYDVGGPPGASSYNPVAGPPTAAYVSAIIYRFNGTRWVVRGIYKNLFQSGQNGLVGLDGDKDPMGKPIVTPHAVFFYDDAGGGNNGVFDSFADVVVLTKGGLRYAHSIPMGSGNEGAEVGPFYGYDGSIQSLSLDASGKVHAHVVFSGRAQIIPKGPIVDIGHTTCEMVENEASKDYSNGYVTHDPRCEAIVNTDN